MNRCILIVAVGAATSQGQSDLELFKKRVEAAFPHLPTRLALTSERVRTRLAQQGQKSDSVEKALLKLHYEKFSQVAVQPLYALAGLEYEEIARTVEAFEKNYTDIVVRLGEPLLPCETPCETPSASHEDRLRSPLYLKAKHLATALLSAIPEERAPHDLVLWMGHGSRHQADWAYNVLAEALQQLDSKAFVATMDGTVNFERVMPTLLAHKNDLDLVPQVWLLPLLSIIGRHALEDMAGDQPDSWKSMLQAQGFRVRPILSGLVENEAVADIWLERLAASLGQC